MGECADWHRSDDEGKDHESKHTSSLQRLGMDLALKPSKARALPATEPHLCSFRTPKTMALCSSNSRMPTIWWLNP